MAALVSDARMGYAGKPDAGPTACPVWRELERDGLWQRR